MKKKKAVTYDKMSKKAQKEARNANRVYFSKIQTTVAHKSDADYNRKKEKEKLRELRAGWQ